MELEPNSGKHDTFTTIFPLVFFFSYISKQIEKEMELSGAFVFLFPFS